MAAPRAVVSGGSFREGPGARAGRYRWSSLRLGAGRRLAALPHLEPADRLVAEALVHRVAQLGRLQGRGTSPPFAALGEGDVEELAGEAAAAMVLERGDEVDAAVVAIV